tara:strand:- start:16 stop:225 length:210 start_codon:yes stop_codon:yes gene_type:complete
MIWLRGHINYMPTRLQPDLDNASVGNLLQSHLKSLIKEMVFEPKRFNNFSNNNHSSDFRQYWPVIHAQK